jgi:hypothetical protein
METKDNPVGRKVADPTESATPADDRKRSFPDLERDLEPAWSRAKGPTSTTQPWHDAKEAAKEAWARVRRP